MTLDGGGTTQTVQVSGFSPEFAEEVHLIAETVNDEFADLLRLMARSRIGFNRKVTAHLIGINPTGFELWAEVAEGPPQSVNLEFGEPVHDGESLRRQISSLVAGIRRDAPSDEPITELETQMAHMRSLSLAVAKVSKIEDLSPNMRLVTVKGEFSRYRSAGVAEFVAVYVPKPGYEDAIKDGLDVAELTSLTEDVRPDARTYTVREWRPENHELDMWFLLHSHAGPVSEWAKEARVGDSVGIWGPRANFKPPEGTRHFLLVGDETFLPAAASVLDSLDADQTATVVIEATGPNYRIQLPESDRHKVEWVYRGATKAEESNLLPDAVRGMNLESSGLYVFGGAEKSVARSVRRILRERGLASDQVRVSTYWHTHEHQ